MASPPLSQHPRATVCLQCGDVGAKELLVYCRNCRDSCVHAYCMEVIKLNDNDIRWWCWDCRENDSIKAEPPRKSERMSFKRKEAQTTRNYLKQKLHRKKKLVRISKDISETGRLDDDGQGLEADLANERQRDILEKEKPVPEIVSNSEHDESIKIDEPTFTTDSKLPDEQEDMVKSFDEIQTIPESGNNEKILVVMDSNNAQYDGMDVDLQVPLLASEDMVKSCAEIQAIPESENNEKIIVVMDSNNAQNDGMDVDLQVSLSASGNLPWTPDTLCRQPSSEPDDFLYGEPVIAPVWRGWFNIEVESEMISIEILAHLSNKASSKVSDAAAAITPILDLQFVDKNSALPKHFRATPPTTASIGLYFFPACERDERVYDSLLEEVIEKDLALTVVTNNLQLLIFSSYELPLRNCRYKSKTFLWGLFKKTQRSYSSAKASLSGQRSNNTQLLRLTQAIPTGNNEDLVCSQPTDYPSQNFQSPMSVKSSQSSNILPSMQNTPDSLALSLS